MDMQRVSRHLGRWCLLLLVPLWLAASQATESRLAVVLDIDGAIGPATKDYIARGLGQAQDRGAELVILRMDTPGGLDSSMRDIIKAIMASPVPVVSYVAPGGARAASAGTYILYASHVAAMAPATNLGAATPVAIGGLPGMPSEPEGEEPAGSGEPPDDGETTGEAEPASDGKTAMERKRINDAAAYIRGLAERYDRNADWAERAVREAVSLSARKALDKNVIEVVAGDLGDLLEQINGRSVSLSSGERTLDTTGLTVERIQPDWRTKLLAVLTDPNVAYILMLIGIYGLIFELANPGAVVPGVIGGIALLLALYAFQVLPINYAGLGLILLGVAFMVAEAFAPSFGILGLGGIVAFVVGSIVLVDEDSIGISMPLIGTTALLTALFFIWVIGKFIGLRRRQPVTGVEQLTGSVGHGLEDFTGQGRVWIHSEAWNAVSTQPVRAAQPVRVLAVDGLTLQIEPLSEETP